MPFKKYVRMPNAPITQLSLMLVWRVLLSIIHPDSDSRQLRKEIRAALSSMAVAVIAEALAVDSRN